MTEAWVGLGSNLGDREGHLRAAVSGLAGLGEVVCVSPVYETAPVGFLEQGPFLNCVAGVRSSLSAAAFLEGLQELERVGGRVRSVVNGPRTIDLDLLLWGGEVLELDGLVVPHPRMHLRGFVLAPLCDLVPEMVHPVLGRSMRELMKGLEEWPDLAVRRRSGDLPYSVR